MSNPSPHPSYPWDAIQADSQIGKYRIIEKLGGGGMGVVYRAEDTRLKRQVALKFLAPELTRDPEARERFVREAQAASALDHPNICTIYEIDETPQGLTFIAMACYEGETLKKRMAGGPLPVDQAIDIAIQIGRGLTRAHAKGIVHRDIKPANTMVLSDGERETVKILDFGLAKVTDVSLTRTGSTLGTVAYMSPEQARGENVDARTDVWSLGAVLYEMLAGERAFPGEFEHAVTYALLYEPHKPLRQVRPDLPDELEQILDRALAKDREERYRTMEAFLGDLSACRNPETKPRATARPSSSRQKIARPGIKSWVLAAGLGGVLIAAIALYLFGSSSQPSTPAVQAVPRQVTFTGKAYGPALSPDGQLMAYFSQDTDSTGSIRIQEVLGGQPLTVLTNITESDQLRLSIPIRWSPDGTMLAVAATVDGERKLYLLPRLGGQIRSYSMGTLNISWSPDGSQIGMMSSAGNFMRLLDISSMEIDSIALPIARDFWRGFDWSPQGDRFAFSTQVSSTFNLLTYSRDDEVAQVVISDSTEIYSPRWAADGESLYYLKFGGLEMELWKVQVSSTTGKREGSPRRIQGGLHDLTQFSLSDDNTRLLYHDPNTHYNLWSITIDELEQKTSWEKLTEGTSWLGRPRVSPDGQHIAFIKQNALGRDVYTMPLSGGESQQHTFTADLNGELAWSRDGQELAFGADEDGMPVVTVLNVSSGRTRSFKSDRFGMSNQLTWGPGERILYQRPDNRNFYVLDPETGEVRPLVTNDSVGWMFNPRYSPDEEHVAVFWNQRAGGIWTISTIDGSQNRIQSFQNFTDPLTPLKWSLDGAWIYAMARSQYPQSIVKLAIDGSERRKIASLPHDGNYRNTDVSSDGKYIVVSLPETQSDIWMLENFDPEVPAK